LYFEISALYFEISALYFEISALYFEISALYFLLHALCLFSDVVCLQKIGLSFNEDVFGIDFNQFSFYNTAHDYRLLQFYGKSVGFDVGNQEFLCVGTEVVCKAYGGIVFINLEIRNNPSAIKDTVAHVPVSASQKRKTGYFYIGGIKVQVNSHLGVAVIKKPGKNRMLLCICVKDHEKRE